MIVWSDGALWSVYLELTGYVDLRHTLGTLGCVASRRLERYNGCDNFLNKILLNILYVNQSKLFCKNFCTGEGQTETIK